MPEVEVIQEQRPNRFKEAIQLPLFFIAILWIIHLLQVALDMKWGLGLGVKPNTVEGLWGILFAPLLHSDFAHLLSNSVPLLVLGTIIRYFYPTVLVRSFVMIYFLTGIMVWLLADVQFSMEAGFSLGDYPKNRWHFGASGVVYGLLAFVFWNGIFRRSLQSIVLSLVVMVLYAGYFEGVLPNQEGISWQSHLYGAFVGIFTSYYYRDEWEQEEMDGLNSRSYTEEEIDHSQRHFLPRDTFEMTKRERAQKDDTGWISDRTW